MLTFTINHYSIMDRLLESCDSTSLPSNSNAPIWSISIEMHGKFLLGRLLLLARMPVTDMNRYPGLSRPFYIWKGFINLVGTGRSPSFNSVTPGSREPPLRSVGLVAIISRQILSTHLSRNFRSTIIQI